MAPQKSHPVTGLLSNSDRPFQLHRLAVPTSLEAVLEYLWVVTWQLPPGERFISENLPHPCPHWVYDPERSGLFGPVKGRFNKELTGNCWVIGARVKIGVMTELTGDSMNTWVDQVGDFNQIFPWNTRELDLAMAGAKNWEEGTKLYQELLDQGPWPMNLSPDIALVQKIEADIRNRNDWFQVQQVCGAYDLSERQLERLFKKYVGLTPKWTLRLNRLQQLTDRVVADEPIDWADLAVQLGYFDQAHCLRDFKNMTGKSPGDYRPS